MTDQSWKLRLRDVLGVSMSALKFLPDTETEAKFEICRWATRGNLASKAIDFPGVGDENYTARIMHAFAVWRAAVRHVIDNTHPDMLNSNANITVHGTATLVVASQWAAFDHTLGVHPAFEQVSRMGEDAFMRAVKDALNTFALEMKVGGCASHLYADADVSASTQQRIIELHSDGAKMIPPVFQRSLVQCLASERKKAGPRPFGETEFDFCFEVEDDEAGWKALAAAVEHRWQASIQEARGRP